MSNKISILAMLVMAIVSFSNLSGYSLAGISIIIGVLFYFSHQIVDRNIHSENTLSMEDFGNKLKNKSVWFWIALPLVMNVICLTLAALFLPPFIDHLFGRIDIAVSAKMIVFLILQLAILALGEEIAWRGFFQKHLSKWLPIIPTLIITSILFSLGHYAVGDFAVISYDMFFIFINSVLYGIVFYKTNNIFVSAFSHFIANLFIIIFFF